MQKFKIAWHEIARREAELLESELLEVREVRQLSESEITQIETELLANKLLEVGQVEEFSFDVPDMPEELSFDIYHEFYRLEAEYLVNSLVDRYLPNRQRQIEALYPIKRDENSINFSDQKADFTIIFDSAKEMTPDYLGQAIIPYLQAIANIQRVVDEVRGELQQKIKINAIMQNSPITISLGVVESLELIMNIVVPWRNRHAKAMAELKELEKSVQIETLKADVVIKRIQSNTDRQSKRQKALEFDKQQVELERLKLENEKLRLQLHQNKIQLALDILAQVSSNLTEVEKIDYAMKLLDPLDIPIFSELEPKLTLLEEDIN